MNNRINTTLSLSMAAVLAAGAGLSSSAFGMQAMPAGYQVADASGKMEEAKCAAKTQPAKSEEGKCGANAQPPKAEEGKCGANAQPTKAEEAKCGANKPTSAVDSHTADQVATNMESSSAKQMPTGKAKDGKCGEGKCGANKK